MKTYTPAEQSAVDAMTLAAQNLMPANSPAIRLTNIRLENYRWLADVVADSEQLTTQQTRK